MGKPPLDTFVPQRRGERKMACAIDDREGESPSPVEPRLGRTFHSSATGRRRKQTLPEAPGLRQALHPRDDTAGKAGDRHLLPVTRLPHTCHSLARLCLTSTVVEVLPSP